MNYDGLRDHLSRQFDTIATAQIIVIYLHDLSVTKLVLALVIQTGALSPALRLRRLESLPSAHILGIIVICSMLNLLWHSVTEMPMPDSDGRLHGRLLTEFIGVLPARRLVLYWWDLVLFCLQLACFAVVHGEQLVLGDYVLTDGIYPYDVDEPPQALASGNATIFCIDLPDLTRRCRKLLQRPSVDSGEASPSPS